MNISKKAVGFKKYIKKHGLLFHINILVYPLLGICYVASRQISCRCSACLSKMATPWNISQYKYNQD